MQLLKALDRARRYGGKMVMPWKFVERRMAKREIKWKKKRESESFLSNRTDSSPLSHEENCVSKGEGDIET